MNYKFGKHPPKIDKRTLQFERYAAAMAKPRPASSNLATIFAKLGISDIGQLFPMDGNDVEGCCTIAAWAHLDTGFAGVLGKKRIPAARDVHHLYRKLTGGGDTGLNMLDVLNYVRKHSSLGDRAFDFASVNLKNHDLVKLAIDHFRGIFAGMNCQVNAIPDFEAHRTWTPGKLSGDGHAVAIIDYTPEVLKVLTWGGIIDATWAWFDKCVDEAYPILPKDAKTTGWAPGFDFAGLEKDIQAIGAGK